MMQIIALLHGVRSPNPTRRKTMTDKLILTILIALACPLLLPVVIEEEEA